MSILVINAGSSTLKYGLFDAEAGEEIYPSRDREGAVERPLADARGSDIGGAVSALANSQLIKGQPPVTIVGYRVVHGGTTFRASVLIDDKVKAEIERLTELAPLHNPHALAAIKAGQQAFPAARHVAAFDTAYFADLPPAAHVYALPYKWYSEWGIRRFGFHGISHAYLATRAAEMLGATAGLSSSGECAANRTAGQASSGALRLVLCHLGNGCSATAVRGGKPVATTMGFTPLEGLMMGTRPGSVDPGILLYIQRQHDLTAEQIEEILSHESGLLGVSGLSSDCRELEAAAKDGHERAALALEMFAASVRSTVGALSVALGGVDALVFSAGIGENSAHVRADICRGLECLGLRLDAPRNAQCRPDADIATVGSPGRILAIHTREELWIARESRQVVQRL